MTGTYTGCNLNLDKEDKVDTGGAVRRMRRWGGREAGIQLEQDRATTQRSLVDLCDLVFSKQCLDTHADRDPKEKENCTTWNMRTLTSSGNT